MKRLKLHKKHELMMFIEDCNRAISQMGCFYIPNKETTQKLISNNKLREVFDIYNSNHILWEGGFCIFLSQQVRNTFKYYRSLVGTEFNKKISKRIRE